MTEVTNNAEQKKDELHTFLFLTIFLAPFLSIAIVGVLGFSIWFSQLLMGPPGV